MIKYTKKFFSKKFLEKTSWAEMPIMNSRHFLVI